MFDGARTAPYLLIEYCDYIQYSKKYESSLPPAQAQQTAARRNKPSRAWPTEHARTSCRSPAK